MPDADADADAAGAGADGAPPEKQLAKWMRQRRFVIKEIIGSEKKYIDFMNLLVDVFARPSAPLMAGDMHKAIFRDIDFIKNLNQKLLQDLNSAYEELEYDDKYKMGVGTIMIRFAPFLNLYMDYYTGHDQALLIIKEIQRQNHAVAKLWAAGAKDPRCRGSTIEFLLIMPIQRIPRYVLLLKSLIKETPEEFMAEERALCEKAQAQVKAVAMKMDHAIEVRQATLALLEVKHEFKPELEFLNVEDDRQLLLRGYVKLRDHSRNRLVKGEHLAVLFSDMLIVGRKMRNGTHSLEEHLAPIAANGDPIGRVIRIAGEPCTADMNSTVELSFQGQPDNEYDHWLDKLQEVCARYASNGYQLHPRHVGLHHVATSPALRPGGGRKSAPPRHARIKRSASGPLHSLKSIAGTPPAMSPKSIHPALRRLGGSLLAMRHLQSNVRRTASFDSAASGQLPNIARSRSLSAQSSSHSLLDSSTDDHEPSNLANSHIVWERDEDVPACRICGKEFNVLVRRHHCRVCGRIVCAKCSKYRVAAADAGIQTPHGKVRSCSDCFEELCVEESSDDQNSVVSPDNSPSNAHGSSHERRFSSAADENEVFHNAIDVSATLSSNDNATPGKSENEWTAVPRKRGGSVAEASEPKSAGKLELEPVSTLTHRAPPPPPMRSDKVSPVAAPAASRSDQSGVQRPDSDEEDGEDAEVVMDLDALIMPMLDTSSTPVQQKHSVPAPPGVFSQSMIGDISVDTSIANQSFGVMETDHPTDGDSECHEDSGDDDGEGDGGDDTPLSMSRPVSMSTMPLLSVEPMNDIGASDLHLFDPSMLSPEEMHKLDSLHSMGAAIHDVDNEGDGDFSPVGSPPCTLFGLGYAGVIPCPRTNVSLSVPLTTRMFASALCTVHQRSPTADTADTLPFDADTALRNSEFADDVFDTEQAEPVTTTQEDISTDEELLAEIFEAPASAHSGSPDDDVTSPHRFNSAALLAATRLRRSAHGLRAHHENMEPDLALEPKAADIQHQDAESSTEFVDDTGVSGRATKPVVDGQQAQTKVPGFNSAAILAAAKMISHRHAHHEMDSQKSPMSGAKPSLDSDVQQTEQCLTVQQAASFSLPSSTVPADHSAPSHVKQSTSLGGDVSAPAAPSMAPRHAAQKPQSQPRPVMNLPTPLKTSTGGQNDVARPQNRIAWASSLIPRQSSITNASVSATPATRRHGSLLTLRNPNAHAEWERLQQRQHNGGQLQARTGEPNSLDSPGAIHSSQPAGASRNPAVSIIGEGTTTHQASSQAQTLDQSSAGYRPANTYDQADRRHIEEMFYQNRQLDAPQIHRQAGSDSSSTGISADHGDGSASDDGDLDSASNNQHEALGATDFNMQGSAFPSSPHSDDSMWHNAVENLRTANSSNCAVAGNVVDEGRPTDRTRDTEPAGMEVGNSTRKPMCAERSDVLRFDRTGLAHSPPPGLGLSAPVAAYSPPFSKIRARAEKSQAAERRDQFGLPHAVHERSRDRQNALRENAANVPESVLESELAARLHTARRALARQQIAAALLTQARLATRVHEIRFQTEQLKEKLAVALARGQKQRAALRQNQKVARKARRRLDGAQLERRATGPAAVLQRKLANLRAYVEHQTEQSRSRIAHRVRLVREAAQRKIERVVDTAAKLIQLAREQSLRRGQDSTSAAGNTVTGRSSPVQSTDGAADEAAIEFPQLATFLKRYFAVVTIRDRCGDNGRADEAYLADAGKDVRRGQESNSGFAENRYIELGVGSSRVASHFSHELGRSSLRSNLQSDSKSTANRVDVDSKLRFATGVDVQDFYESIVRGCSLLSRRWRVLVDRNYLHLKKVQNMVAGSESRGQEWFSVAVYFARASGKAANRRHHHLRSLLQTFVNARSHPPCRVANNSSRSAMALWLVAPLLGTSAEADFAAARNRRRVPQRLVLVRAGPDEHVIDRLVTSAVARSNGARLHFGTMWALGVAHMLLRLDGHSKR